MSAFPRSRARSVNSTDALPGGYGKVAVRVPNESPTAGTTKVSLTLPADSPVPSVSVKPHPGWTVTAPKVKLPEPVTQSDVSVTEAVTTLTWTADPGVSIKPGQFDISLGRLPADAKELLLLPAKIASASAGAAAPAAENATESSPPASGLAPGSTAGSIDGMARGLGAGALLVALGGAGMGLRQGSASG